MAILLGKRKRVVVSEPASKPRSEAQKAAPTKRRKESDASSDGESARALFQKAFEAKFKPLPIKEKKKFSEIEDEIQEDESEDNAGSDLDDEDLSGSDWSGIEDGDEEVEIVQHVLPEFTRGGDSADPGKKAFMSSKPPTLDSTQKPTPLKSSKTTTAKEDEESSLEAANLKNDLALQRLLSESHLLTPSATTTQPTGASRLLALDQRLQTLGAKTSLLKQTNMPLAHRKGIVKKGAEREVGRRKEARENGVVLEREKKVGKGKDVRRERGLGAPGVGRMRGGTLRLSEGDVRSIEGRGGGRGGKRGGRGRGRGR
ncbi:unnamed protein product [Zymoseptoria tritici ST99CH_3D7]|uniref:Uncharacterized protein n=1 Tax=Zymoseptoria tritici (strain ST99CH_3D7) TaxID=1276538 RepID=A0A1X7S1Z3_ZYMT9|nr:unnamed protein product [Zymoseptoria tritici ST99CH_3D7]